MMMMKTLYIILLFYNSIFDHLAIFCDKTILVIAVITVIAVIAIVVLVLLLLLVLVVVIGGSSISSKMVLRPKDSLYYDICLSCISCLNDRTMLEKVILLVIIAVILLI